MIQTKKYKKTLCLTKKILMLLSSVVIFVGCGEMRASQHPDEMFQDGRDISSFDEADSYMFFNNNNPKFRQARVTTSSGSLRLKTSANSSAASPSSGSRSLSKGDIISVYWPSDIVNNHIKVFVANKTLWVTYKSNAGTKYVTLLEDISMPIVAASNSFIISGPVSSIFGGEPMGPVTSSVNVSSINLPSSAISEAHAAISAVNLRATEVRACQFNPLVGNSAAKSNCYNKIVISQDFRNFIANHGYQCAQQASRDAFGRSASKVLFHSSYAGQVKRNRTVSGTNKKSIHATGQALDLFAVSLSFPGSSTRRVTLHKNQTDGSSGAERENHKFYWSYVNCWRSKVRAHSPCNCSSSLSGAMTYLENSAHHNHVHMSLPFCERSRFNVSCV